MRYILLVLTLALSASSVSAQTFHQWVPGLDIVVPAYQGLDKEGNPLPATHFLGYDQTSHLTSLLDVGAQCHIAWWTRPTAGHGAITQIMQVGPPGTPRVWAYYHESGMIRVEPQPDAFFCQPVPQLPGQK